MWRATATDDSGVPALASRHPGRSAFSLARDETVSYDDLMPYWLSVNVSALGVEQISNP